MESMHAFAQDRGALSLDEAPWCGEAPAGSASLCMRCPLRVPCVGAHAAQTGTRRLLAVLAGRRQLQPGESVFRRGEPFACLYVVRGGCFKSVAADGAVRGFHLPGETVGIEGLAARRHPCTLVALEDSEVCALRYDPRGESADRPYAGRLWDMMSRELLRARGEAAALQRLAPGDRVLGLLASLSLRMRPPGSPRTTLRLALDAGDIASHLRLAAQDVEDALAGLEARGWLQVRGAVLHFAQPERMQQEVQRLRRG